MEFVTKNMPVDHVKLGDKIFTCEDVSIAISDMLENTEEDASIWGPCVKDYDLDGPGDVYDCLTEMGLVKQQTGERMSHLYCMAAGAEEKLRQMRQEIWDYEEKPSEEKTYEEV